MKSTALSFLSCLCLVGLMTVQSEAATLAWFEHTALPVSQSSSVVFQKDANLTVGDFTANPAAWNTGIGWPDGVGAFANNLPVGESYADAVTAGRYFNFTVTPDAGYSVDYESLDLLVSINGGGNNASSVDISLSSSADGYATQLATVTAAHDQGHVNAQQVALSDSLGTVLQGITTPLEFRLYLHNRTGVTNRIAFGHVFDNADNVIDNDVRLFGTVSLAIPEPSAIAMLLLGAAGTMLRRRS